MERSSSVSLAITAPQRPVQETSLEPDSAAKSDPREEKENEEEEQEGESCARDDAKGQSLDPEWVEERFRIDRKKLETMLYGECDGFLSWGGGLFLRRLPLNPSNVTMERWPFKLGCVSSDPLFHLLDKVSAMLTLNTRYVLKSCPHVTLKMDVAFTEHSHVIGKGGGNIKKVMEATCCHIHFPDSNRHNAAGEKSNQVSIAGPIEGVEEARRRIRFLHSLGAARARSCCQGYFHLQHSSHTAEILYQSILRLVCVNLSSARQKATCILMELLLGSEAPGGIVSSQLDVTAQQHLFLLGQNGANFLSVMHKTQTQIILPDLSAPQSPPSLLIQGSPDGVCLARRQLMDCLPVCLMFDMREDGEGDPCNLTQMMQNLGVFICVKPKAKQTSKSVVVKGLERNISCIYEARRLLLGLDSCETAEVTTVSPDLVSPGGGLANYWLHILLQQLHLSEQGSAPAQTTEVLTGTKRHPSPPPGLTSPADEGRAGLKGTDSCQLEKVSHCPCSRLQKKRQKNPHRIQNRKPVVTEVRTPTDTWSGLGFSKSMPAEAIKELRSISRRCYKPYLSANTNQQCWTAQLGKACVGSESENWRERRGSTSLLISSSSPSSSSTSSPSTPPPSTCSQRSPSPLMMDDLPELLSQLGLIKYIDLFEQQEIDYQTFLTLSEEDLKEVGVSTFGARRKMLLAISDLKRSKRRPSDAQPVKPDYLEGGASGRLPRILDVDVVTTGERRHQPDLSF
uniref:Bicaudal C homolog 2 n=1 Tax=Fundulus heteroclitus TaxID=8078 RepID=A0A3Q2Q2C8_FUNHE